MVRIKRITPGSPAARAGIIPGDLVSINGNEINDVLDLQFYGAEANPTVEIVINGVINTYSIKKPPYDDIGFEFDSYLIDCERSCTNNCVFCFIDQNPPGMRETIYFKDDDSRLSFLQGNYITLTNLSDRDIDRIIKMKLSVNISLHTMNPALREKMMRNRFAGRGIEYLKRLVTAGIAVNIQLVLCPGLNDGAELVYTLEKLLTLNADNAVPDAIQDAIQSIAAVPVGLTAHREGLYPLEPFNRESARAVIDTIADFQTHFSKASGSRRVYASDEFFLIAGLPVPEAEYYEDYPQYENGVGMLRSFIDEFNEAVTDYDGTGEDTYSVIVTGESAFETVSDLCRQAARKHPHIHAEVIAVKNRFFGGHVTVTGLLTGSDIITALRGRELKGTLLLCEDMFKKDTELFLDDLTLSDVEKALNIKALKIKRDGFSLFSAIKE